MTFVTEFFGGTSLPAVPWVLINFSAVQIANRIYGPRTPGRVGMGNGLKNEQDDVETERSGERCGDMSARIKLAETAEEREQVFRFRYQI